MLIVGGNSRTNNPFKTQFQLGRFKVAMRNHFFPNHIRRQKCIEFTRFNQRPNMSVEEYTQKFMEYSRFCPNIVPDNAIMTQKYEDVLSVKIQKKLVWRYLFNSFRSLCKGK